jgi:hypothetical protein
MDAALLVSCEPVTCDFAAVIGDERRFRFETPPRGERGFRPIAGALAGLARGWVTRPKVT